ncbi:CheR family methyltransferase [Paracidobacterium acidisoli]|uniref:protein-glutamate O-methyltransferase n=1 Tax=Paracidobacterium acidisoli TaxID=2303751 RepID=A0A372IPW6_9BACT|nr:protein-glutamate O-methyltransferase CheR [Paracidobacterium acidisoli]MBT9331351.1 protein-glutamate O-methyltransferase CheR [Paracidobacterium acidisoli]
MAMTATDFDFLRTVVSRNSGNQIDPSRDYLFESRLGGLLRAQGLTALDQLVAALKLEPDARLQRSVAEAMTINETSFFRDNSPFELLRTALLPALIERRRHIRSLRFWSAASSTGQEAWSLAMLLREHFPDLASWRIEILGTDLSAEMVERARAARYQRLEVNRGLPARFLLKYMVRIDDEWEVAPALRPLCRFEQRNLCRLPVLLDTFDGIFLRNVMLYFSAETRRHVLLEMHRALSPDGFLVLGSSEQPGMPQHWLPVLTEKTCYYRPLPAAG